MSPPLLYSSHGQTTFVLDIPSSLETGNGGGRILSATPRQTPYISPEPAGQKRDALIATFPIEHLNHHRSIQDGIAGALRLVRSNLSLKEWCLTRVVGDGTQAGFASAPVSENVYESAYVPVILSPVDNHFRADSCLHNQPVYNPHAVPVSIQISDVTLILIPSECSFIWSTMASGLDLLSRHIVNGSRLLFDLILMDPPWANRSVRRGLQYSTANFQALDPFEMALLAVERHLKPDGYVAIWITNKAAVRDQVLRAMTHLAFTLREEWIWVKITGTGEPLTPLNGIWRSPYEVLLVFRQITAPETPVRRHIFAVPDLHSRKPNLAELFNSILLSSYVLELFARNLTSGWVCIGNEVLKFQDRTSWHEWPESLGAHRIGKMSVDVPKDRKAFVPLENNPEVMTRLAHELGLSQNLQFHEVYSLTEPTLLEFLPRPAYALLLVFPVTDTYEKFREEEDASRENYSASGAEEPVVWFKQTIRNACGLIGLLHVLTNGEAREQVVAGSNLEKLLRDAIPLGPIKRADLLYNSDSLEAAHATAAATGDSKAPDANAAIDLHFVAFIKDKENNLWELDGRRKGPLNRGKLAADQDVLSEQGLDLGVQSFLKREEQAGGGEMRFSVIMLGPSLD